MIETNAAGPSIRAGGSASNFSISGKLMSTWGLPELRRASISSGSRCKVCGPKTRSTYGARATMAAPSWLAKQPPTPMRSSGRAFFSGFTRPRSWKTFSCAFSRTEQVLKRIRSASSGRSVGSKPFAARKTSAILSESYSFIWQPKVRMNTFFATLAAPLGLTLSSLGGCEEPHAEDLPLGIERVIGHGTVSRDGHRHDDQVLLVADLRAGGKLHRFAVNGDGHGFDVANDACPCVRRDGRWAVLREERRGQQAQQESKVRSAAMDHGPKA